VWNDWVTQSWRVYAGRAHVELQETVGPIPISDGLGKEIITQYITEANLTNSTWYTDAQGLEIQTRIRNHRATWNLSVNEPVAGNYYPVDMGSFIRDYTADIQLTLINDRSSGMSSIYDGEIEVMVHRRLLHDDGRGVGQPLNESNIVREIKNLIINGTSISQLQYRTQTITVNRAELFAFGPSVTSASDWFSTYPVARYEPLQYDLPKNVILQSLSVTPDGLVLLRLHHLFEVNEDPVWSQPATVDLSTLFTNLLPVEMIETSLTANQPLNEVSRMQWRTGANESQATFTRAEERRTQTPMWSNNFNVTLMPMEIRTFLVRFESTQ